MSELSQPSGMSLLQAPQLLAGAQQNVDFTGLDGNRDGIYVIRGKFVQGSGVPQATIELNGNPVTIMAGLFTDGAAVAGATGYILYCDAARTCQFTLTIDARTGLMRLGRCLCTSTRTAGDNNLYVFDLGFNWTDTAANLTDIRLAGGAAGYFSAGGIFGIYGARRPV